jgi:hypothetical protein
MSFILSSTLAHWYDTIFTRGFYTFSAVWTGVLSNAFFILAFLWIVSSIFLAFHFPHSLSIVGWIGIIIVTLLSVYGLIQAARPMMREETIYIQNLPKEWEGKKIVQMTDIHLGHIIRSDFARKIVDMSNATNPAMVLIVGDMLDGMDGHLDGLLEPFSGLHSQYGTYFVTGNHETYLGVSHTLDIVKKTNIQIIDNLLVNLGGLQLIGIASPERGQKQDVAEILKKVGFNSMKPSVLLYHAPIDRDIFRSLGISLQLAGHTHRGQLYPYNLITNLVYEGYDFGVYNEGDYTLSVSSGVGTW